MPIGIASAVNYVIAVMHVTFLNFIVCLLFGLLAVFG